MDFDEYEYLENMVENPGLEKLEGKVNGVDGIEESEEKGRSRSSKHRNDDDLDRPSKRLRSEKESRGLERDKRLPRSANSRDRDRVEKDKPRSTRDHRDRDKKEDSGMEKDRERDRARDTEKERERGNDKRRDGHKERVEREYERERERDWEGEQDRSRGSRNHSERHHDIRGRENSRDVESTDIDFKERRKERNFRDPNHENRKYKEKKEAVDPPPDPERDQRTVFAYQISLKAAERDIYEFFSKAGKVRDVRLITDRNTGRSRGVGYIEFVDVMSVPMAIALSGQLLCGQPMMVKPSEAEKNLVQSTTAASGGGGLGPYSGGARRLYVGNLPVTIKEDQLRQVFEPFGMIELVQMPVDLGTGNCKGYAFVQFARLEDAKLALNLNGQLEIGGRVIKVSAITDQAGMEEAGANMADLDDDEGSGLSLNAHSRALLMQKLDRTGTSASINASFGTPVVDSHGVSMPATAVTGQNSASPMDTIGIPSECLLLKNMFDPNSEVEPDFELDIKEDVQEECSKFGTLKHIYVDKNTSGFVYLRFENTQSAMAAQRALHGRWFAGKMITATFLLPHDYEAKFPNSG